MSEHSIEFAGVGDLYLVRNNPAGAFEGFAELLADADITFGNLEAPCSSRGAPTIGKYIVLKMEPDVVPALAWTGFDIVAVANNHAIDYGREAFSDTLDLLDQAGIARIGGGYNVKEARRAVILERNGLRVGFVGYATTVPWGYAATSQEPGIAAIGVRTRYEPRYQIMAEQPGTPANVITEIDAEDLEHLVGQVRSLKEQTDIVVASLHWGVAFVPDPVSYQRELARAVVDAGADIILGHHAHVIQGVEMYGGAPIFYSLSNFVFDRNNPKFGVETFVVSAKFSKDGLDEVAVVPAMLPLCGDPRPLHDEERAAFKAQMEQLSEGMNSRFSWAGDRLKIAIT